MPALLLRWLVACVALAAAGRAEEPALDVRDERRWRDALAAGRIAAAQEAAAEMLRAPHSRAGLLLWEALVRAHRRVERSDATLPELEAQRDALRAERARAEESTSPTQVKRLDRQLADFESRIAAQLATRQVELRLRVVVRDAFSRVVARLLHDGADALAGLLLRELERERETPARCLLLELLGELRSGLVMVPLMEQAIASRAPVEVRLAALVALGRRGDPGAAPAAAAALDHPDWRLQVEAVEALRRFHQRSAIPLLIARLERAQGRLLDDLGAALRSLSGQRFAADAATWRRWWDEHGATFAMPREPARAAEVAAAGEERAPPAGGTQFFGIGSFSKRLVFVIDFSGSMNEAAGSGGGRTKKTAACAQLAAALAALPSDARFEVLAYSSSVEAAFGALVPADDEHRKAALDFVQDRRPGGGTDLHGALLAALALAESGRARPGQGAPALDTLFFLTDGQATDGRVRTPEGIRVAVADANRALRVRIHAIGVGSHDAAFLAALAADHGGTYAAR